MFNRIRPYQITLFVCAAYLLLTLLTHSGDSRVFVTIGACFAECSGGTSCTIGPENGYDGQFSFYIARDPAHAAPCIDVPAYRYQRILLPIMGRLLAFGVEDFIPLAFVAINLFALVASTWLLESLLAAQKVSRVYALAYGLFGGLVIAVRLSTSEPLAYGLCLLALWLGQEIEPPRRQEHQDVGAQRAAPTPYWRIWGIPIALALAALAKETTLLFAGAFTLYYLAQRRWLDALRTALIAGLPFALWQLYLYNWLGAFGVGSGGAGGTPFEIIPFNGILRILTEGSLSAFLLLAPIALLVAALPALWGLIASARELWRERGGAHPAPCVLLVNA
ncbi:MAG: hypothetical protein U0694_25345 [Anaerolineae bacterium]